MPSHASSDPRTHLRELAREALTHYALESPRLTLLSAKEHALFRIDASVPGQSSSVPLALRLYRPDAFHEPSVITEREWLSALRRDAGLAVPDPVPARSGDWLPQIKDERTGGQRAVAVFRWVEGRRRKASLTPNALASVGHFTARLHQHSARFVPSVGHAARRWDWEHVFGEGAPVAPQSDDPRFTQEQRDMLRTISERTGAAMQELGTGVHVWGLIHADLHSSNYLFRGTEVGAIDFEDCGWGYYLYDLAVILDEIYAVFPSQAAAFRAGLLSGYRQIRELSVEHEALLDAFVAMRLAELLRWHALSEDPAHQPAVPQLLDEIERHMARLELA